MEDDTAFTSIFPPLMVTDLINLSVSAVPLLLLFGMILHLKAAHRLSDLATGAQVSRNILR